MSDDCDYCKWCTQEAFFHEQTSRTNTFCDFKCQEEFYDFEAGLRIPGSIKKILQGLRSSSPTAEYTVEKILVSGNRPPGSVKRGTIKYENDSPYYMNVINAEDMNASMQGKAVGRYVQGDKAVVYSDYDPDDGGKHVLIGYSLLAPVLGSDMVNGVTLKFHNRYVGRSTEFTIREDLNRVLTKRDSVFIVNHPGEAMYLKFTRKFGRIPDVVLKVVYSSINKSFYTDQLFLRYETSEIATTLNLSK